MKGNVLSRRYAKAFADIVEPAEMLETVRAELDMLADAVAESTELTIAVKTASKSREEKKGMFGEIAAALNLSAQTSRLLDYLVEKKRISMLPDLAASFREEADRRLNICTAQVTSAMLLTEEQKGRITRKLERITAASVRLLERTDPSLLAGIQVTLRGQFFDGSLLGRLARLRETIAYGA